MRRVALLVAALMAAGCGHESSKGVTYSTGEAAGEAFWFVRGALSYPNGTTMVVQLSEPRRVELRGDQVVDPEDVSWRGTWKWPDGPQAGRGLMLYVQERVTLLEGKGGSASNVTLWPGALVAVVPSDGGYLVAPGPPAEGRKLFAPSSALGPAKPSQPAPPPSTARPSRCWQLDGPQWTPSRCLPVLLGDGGVVTQRVGGVEVLGKASEAAYQLCLDEPLGRVPWTCNATVVRRVPAGLVLSSVEFAPQHQAIDRVPKGFRRIVRGGAWDVDSVHVLVLRDRIIGCSTLFFDAPSGKLRYGDAERAYRYDEATSTLAVDMPHCLADVLFVVGRDGDEIQVLRRPLVDDALFYRVAEAERWFEREEACARAASEAQKTLVSHPGEVLSLGLHIPWTEEHAP